MFDKSLIVKPAGADCNFDCDYCFYLKKSELYPEVKKHRMSVEVLDEMIRQAMQSSGREVSFVWQGGEPTLMGLDFFKKVIKFQKKHGKEQIVCNAFQTNGYLLNEDWARFFDEYKFLIGLSIDGEACVHNRFRRTAGGELTFKKIWRNLELLKRFNVEFNVLAMVNQESVKYPEKTFNFFLRNEITYMQFIPAVEYGSNGEIADFSVSPSEYGDFLCRIFDLWYNDGQPYASVRDFDSLLYKEVYGMSNLCIYENRCGQHVVVEHNGDVYACDFFVEPRWKYGNLMETPLPSLVSKEKCKEFENRKMILLPECKDCRWLEYCYGGCLKYRDLIKSEPEEKFYFCESYKAFFPYGIPKIRQLAKKVEDLNRFYGDNSSRNVKKKIGRNDPCPCGSGLKYKYCCGI